jgi:probable F420-dependent oxidoreductase
VSAGDPQGSLGGLDGLCHHLSRKHGFTIHGKNIVASQKGTLPWNRIRPRRVVQTEEPTNEDGRHCKERRNAPAYSRRIVTRRFKIKVGFGLGTEVGSALEPANFWSIIDTLESDRWDSIWLSERASGGTFGPIAATAAVAGRTRRLKFGFSVLVLPGRNPVLLAKELATIDALSNGRLMAAFGLGVEDPQEQAVFGVVDRKEAATCSEEAVQLIQRLWTETSVTHEGRHFHVRNFTLLPRPAQTPCPDIWFGGNSRAALRRTAELGTGWLPSFLTPEEYRADADEIRALAEAVGRTIDPEHLGVLIAYVAPRDRARAQDSCRSSRPSNVARPWILCSCSATMARCANASKHSSRLAPASSSSCRWSPRQVWTDELGRLRDNVVRPVEGTR